MFDFLKRKKKIIGKPKPIRPGKKWRYLEDGVTKVQVED